MKKTFSKMVAKSRKELEIIDSHTLKELIDKEEDLIIIDVNDKEEVENRGMISGALNVSLGTLHYKADQDVPEDFKDYRIQDRNKKIVMTCSLGMCAAIGGIIIAGRLGSGSSNAGVMFELEVIAAVVLGGTNLFGGRGTIIGTLLGALTIAMIGNGLILLHVSPFYTHIITGLINIILRQIILY